MLQNPIGWVYCSMFPALAVGFALWSGKLTLALLIALTLVRLLRPLQRLTLLAWASCWAVTWYTFAVWLMHSLEKHQSIFSQIPTYFGAAIFVYYACGAMPLALMDTPQAARPSSGPTSNQREGAKSHNQSTASQSSERPQRQDSHQPELDPYALLGVTAESSDSEIRKAYRHQLALYHPDKVAHLGDELKAVAHRKTLQIQSAFEALCEHSNSDLQTYRAS